MLFQMYNNCCAIIGSLAHLQRVQLRTALTRLLPRTHTVSLFDGSLADVWLRFMLTKIHHKLCIGFVIASAQVLKRDVACSGRVM